jgi:hypothetical protein
LETLSDPALIEKLATISIQPINSATGVKATAFIAKELVSLRPVIQAENLKKE